MITRKEKKMIASVPLILFDSSKKVRKVDAGTSVSSSHLNDDFPSNMSAYSFKKTFIGGRCRRCWLFLLYLSDIVYPLNDANATF